MYYIDRTTHEYPISREQLLERFPSIADPIYWDDATLAAMNVWQVMAREASSSPAYYQKNVEIDPIEMDGVWYQNWITVDMTQEELDLAMEQQRTQVLAQQSEIMSRPVIELDNTNLVSKPILSLESNKVITGDGVTTLNMTVIKNAVFNINGNISMVTNNTVVTSDTVIVMKDKITYTDGNVVIHDATVISLFDNITTYGLTEGLDSTPGVTQVTQQEYSDYMSQIGNILVTYSNPFEVVWPDDPFFPPDSLMLD